MEEIVVGPANAGGYPSVQRIAEAVVAALRGADAQFDVSMIDRYVAELSARATVGHATKSEAQIRRVVAACPRLTSDEAFVFRSQRLREGASRRTVEMELGAARAMIRWAMRCGAVSQDPLATLPRLAIRQGDRRRRPRSFNRAEFQAFMAASEALDARIGGVPQTPNWRFLAATGLRWSEAADLAARDLHGDVLRVAATITKAKRERSVVLPSNLADYFGALRGPLLKARRGGSWKTAGHSSIHRAFRGLMESAGIDRTDAAGRLLTIHSFRRTAGTTWAKEGLSVLHVSRLLGHANTAFTERWYLDTTSEDAVAALRTLREEAKKEARPENASP